MQLIIGAQQMDNCSDEAILSYLNANL